MTTSDNTININNKFIDFQLSEYENIAKAHFETLNQITSFFRYYLLIISAPASLFILFKPQGNFLEAIFNGWLPYINNYLFGGLFIALSIIGFGVYLNIINLRHDALLYARTVNGIRKFFYMHKKMDILTEHGVRVLPKQIIQPSYIERHLFFPIILVFFLINTGYCFLGLYLLILTIKISILFSLAIVPISLILHLRIYYLLAHYREYNYMRSHIIGVDIDGVLNKHCQHFCKLLKKIRHKELKPSEITKIPVHDIKNAKITEVDEHFIFNSTEYWTDMPVINDLIYLRKLYRDFGYKILMFSHRPWPDEYILSENLINYSEKNKFENQLKEWHNYNKIRHKLNVNNGIKSPNLSKFRNKYLTKMAKKDIQKITIDWLLKYNIPFNKLIIETGNIDTTDIYDNYNLIRSFQKDLFTNRFIISKKKKIKYFVEDDPHKAIKLSNICNYVFLIKQPYNNKKYLGHNYEYPDNVILVSGWKELFYFVKDHS